MTDAWIIHREPMDNPRAIHGLCINEPWFSMDRPWAIHGRPMDNPWIAHVAFWIPIDASRICENYKQLIHRSSLDSSWIIHA